MVSYHTCKNPLIEIYTPSFLVTTKEFMVFFHFYSVLLLDSLETKGITNFPFLNMNNFIFIQINLRIILRRKEIFSFFSIFLLKMYLICSISHIYMLYMCVENVSWNIYLLKYARGE